MGVLTIIQNFNNLWVSTLINKYDSTNNQVPKINEVKVKLKTLIRSVKLYRTTYFSHSFTLSSTFIGMEFTMETFLE